MFDISKSVEKKIISIIEETAEENNVKVETVSFALTYAMIKNVPRIIVKPYYNGKYQKPKTIKQFLD